MIPKKLLSYRPFKKIISIYFYIGVNVIGIPELINHKLALYKYNTI